MNKRVPRFDRVLIVEAVGEGGGTRRLGSILLRTAYAFRYEIERTGNLLHLINRGEGGGGFDEMSI